MNAIKKLGEKISKAPKMSKQLKRNLLLSASLLIVCVAVFLNWRLTENSDIIEGITVSDNSEGTADADGKVLGDSIEVSADEDEDDYFSVSVVSRERVRDEAMETYREIADSDTADEESKKTAFDKMTALADNMTTEVNIENLVIAKGFGDCVAVVNDEGVQVIVKSDGLMPAEVAQIRDIVMDQANVDVSAIKIIEHS